MRKPIKKCDSYFPPTLTSTVLLASMLLGAQMTLADDAGKPDIFVGQDPGTCMQEVAGFNLGCTANDVSLANATNIQIIDDGCQFPGDEVTFTADFEVLLTAQARHDVGIWFASDGDPNGDGALTGTCTAATPAYAPDPPWLDLDGTNDDPNGVVQDTCGDINADHNPLFPTITLTVKCIDTDGDGLLNLPYCTSWRQPGANELCTSPLDAFPGAPSKCKCDTGFGVNIPIPQEGSIEVVKELVPSASPGLFNLQVDGVNEATDVGDGGSTGPVTVSAGTDDDPGETHTVGETVGTDTNLDYYDTEINCVNQDLEEFSGNDTGPLAVDVDPNDNWVCTITNTLLITDLAISKVDDVDPVEAGGTLTYTITVENIGLIDALNVQVNDSLPSGITFGSTSGCAEDPGGVPTCSLGTIAAGGSASYTVTVTVNGEVPDQTVLTNTVTVSSDTPDTNPANDTATEDTRVLNDPALAIVKSASPSTYDAVGDVISYSYEVTNTGNVTIYGPITVSDDKATDESCPAGNLATGQSMTCTATYAVDQADLDHGSVTNTAFASGTAPSGDPVNSPTDEETVTAIQNPSLAIDKTASPSTYDEVGDAISYSYLVTNTGNVTIDNVSVSDNNVDADANCLSPILAPTESTTCSAQRTVTQADLDDGSITNTATASGTDPNGAPVVSPPDDETVTAVQLPAIELVKTGSFNDENGDGYADAGETISYSFTVTNTGNVTLYDVSITDPSVAVSGGPIGSLAPGDSDNSTFTGAYTITQGDVDAGEFYNLATACADDPNGDPACDDDDHNEPLPQNPAISITKSPDEQTIAEGMSASFTIRVSNDGNVTLTDVTVSDPLAPDCDRVFASIAVGSFEEYSCTVSNVENTFTNVATATGQCTAASCPVSDDDDAMVDVIPVVEFCENNAPPTAMLMQYSGVDPSVYIVVEHSQDGVIFTGTVADGGAFLLQREDDGGNVKLNPELDVYFYDSEGGSLIDRIDIHTSCSQPLYVGQMFGADLETAKLTLLGEALLGADPDAIEPDDILWRNTLTGENQLYEMDGANTVGIRGVDGFAEPEWKIVGRGDYNGGGSRDILWRNDVTGEIWMYLMNGDNQVGGGSIGTVGLDWKIVGSGDYDGDGRSDILWRNSVTGLNWMYLMNGATIMVSHGVNIVSNLDWQIVGSGDYNGDGKSDILWRNSVTGLNWMYLMNGASIEYSTPVNIESDLNWKIVASGDYNGDGKSDILWRNVATGRNWMYLMNGSTIAHSLPINTESNQDWKIVGSGDYNADGKSDILWRNSVTGLNWMYLMNGNLILTNQLVSVEDVEWMVVNTN